MALAVEVHDGLLLGLDARAAFLSERGRPAYPVQWEHATIRYLHNERQWMVTESVGHLTFTWITTILPC